MKRTKILHWVFTILFAGFMIWSGIPGVEPSAQSVQFLHDYLGYPIYFIQFLSVAKIVGGIVILIPGLNRIKEWAYAGLFFDLAGAIFSVVSVTKTVDVGTAFILLPIILGALSYIFWKKLVPEHEVHTAGPISRPAI
jgi:hypothetical protein